MKRIVMTSLICIAILLTGMTVPAHCASGTSVAIPVLHKTIGGSSNGTVYIVLKPKTIRTQDGTVIPMPDNSRGKMSTLKIEGDGRAAFENIVFNENGVYEYEVEQKKGTDTNISYDSTVYEVKVTVRDGRSYLTISKKNAGVKEDSAEVTFEDKIDKPEAGLFINPKVTKKIKGGGSFANDVFVFTMTPDKQTAELLGSSESYRAKVKGEGTARFSGVPLAEPGTYTFTVRESQNHTMSWNYDDTVYTYIVEVTETDGKLSVKSTKTETAGKNVSEMKYTNEPSAANRIYSNVKTGDLHQWMLVIVFFILGALVMSFSLKPKRDRTSR